MRCAKIANKLKRISTVGSEENINKFKKRMAGKRLRESTR